MLRLEVSSWRIEAAAVLSCKVTGSLTWSGWHFGHQGLCCHRLTLHRQLDLGWLLTYSVLVLLRFEGRQSHLQWYFPLNLRVCSCCVAILTKFVSLHQGQDDNNSSIINQTKKSRTMYCSKNVSYYIAKGSYGGYLMRQSIYLGTNVHGSK